MSSFLFVFNVGVTVTQCLLILFIIWISFVGFRVVIGHTLMTNSLRPDFSILCSGAACPNKPGLTPQPLCSSVAVTARIRGGMSRGLWNELIMTEIVCKRQALSPYTLILSMGVCVHVFVTHAPFVSSGLRVCSRAWVHVYVCSAKRLGTEQIFCSWQQWALCPACMVYGCESKLH